MLVTAVCNLFWASEVDDRPKSQLLEAVEAIWRHGGQYQACLPLLGYQALLLLLESRLDGRFGILRNTANVSCGIAGATNSSP